MWCSLGGVGTFAKAVMFEQLRAVERHFWGNEMTIFLYAGSGKKWRSHGGGRRCFASDKRWSRRWQTLALCLLAYPRRWSAVEHASDMGVMQRQMPCVSVCRRWRHWLTKWPGEHASVRCCAVSVDRPIDASVIAERGVGAFWTASIARQTLERSRVERVWC
jgi:hypothetical protein